MDQKFWLKTVLLLVDAICEKKDKHDPQGTRVDITTKRKVYDLATIEGTMT